MHLLLIGGHVTPAIALIQAAQKAGHAITFIGRTHSRGQVMSQEPQLMQSHGVTFMPLQTAKFNRYQPILSIFKLPTLLGSFIKARQILVQKKPDIVIAFGGYLSVPVCLAAKTLNIPFVIHEQTITLGLANQLLAPLASHVYVSYPQSRAYLKPTAVTVIGNLIRPEFFSNQLSRPAWLPESNRPLIYITGGNQGSQTINQTITQSLQTLVKKYQIVHQTGSAFISQPSPHYYPQPWLSAAQAAYCFKTAQVVISRAGANTVAELIASNAPAILIPLPGTHHDEQVRNAHLIQTAQAGIVMNQNSLNPDKLLSAVQKLSNKHNTYKTNFQSLKHYIHQDAADKLLKLSQTFVVK